MCINKIYKNHITTEEGREINLEYSLTEEEELDTRQYGIRATIVETGESAEVKNISVSKENVLELMENISRCSVTPCTLYDVVYDFLCK